jgi:hypothetical protein
MRNPYTVAQTALQGHTHNIDISVHSGITLTTRCTPVISSVVLRGLVSAFEDAHPCVRMFVLSVFHCPGGTTFQSGSFAGINKFCMLFSVLLCVMQVSPAYDMTLSVYGSLIVEWHFADAETRCQIFV